MRVTAPILMLFLSKPAEPRELISFIPCGKTKKAHERVRTYHGVDNRVVDEELGRVGTPGEMIMALSGKQTRLGDCQFKTEPLFRSVYE